MRLCVATGISARGHFTVASTLPSETHNYLLSDCAAVYKNEREVGEGIKRGMARAGITRKDLFITSKLWNTEHHPDRVKTACEQTLHVSSIYFPRMLALPLAHQVLVGLRTWLFGHVLDSLASKPVTTRIRSCSSWRS